MFPCYSTLSHYNYVTKEQNDDFEVSKLLGDDVVSYLTSTLFRDEDENWKPLSSRKLHEQLKRERDNTFVYSNVINALRYHTNSSFPIIECKLNNGGYETYEVEKISKQYRLKNVFQKNPIKDYILKTDYLILRRKKFFDKVLAKTTKNLICQNLCKRVNKNRNKT